MTTDAIRLGVVGLGRAFVLTLPSFRADDRVRLIAACAPRAESRAAFESEFGGATYASVDDLCANPAVEAVYVATPHQMHVDHALAAAGAGKHLLVEKPLAVSLNDAERIVAACERAGVHLLVGPSHSFDVPVLKARELIASGEFGQLRMVHALNCTDFLYRPRRPEELDTAQGGGVLFSQAVHQVDIVRLLCGGLAREVYALTGAWDARRPSEGAYSALLRFGTGAFASLTYSGYAHFDSDEWQGWVGELGRHKDRSAYGAARRALSGIGEPDEEAAMKTARTYGAAPDTEPASHHEHFGPLIAFCDLADLRIAPDGVHVYADTERRLVACPVRHARASLIDALWAALRDNEPPPQTGRWGMASLEVCHAILESASSGRPVKLNRQIGI